MPNTKVKHQQVQLLLLDLQASMQVLELWALKPPEPSAFESSLPFCCDTMYFSEWLQYVFVPKMHLIVKQGSPLPEKLALLPMAQETILSREKGTKFLSVLKQIDELFDESE